MTKFLFILIAALSVLISCSVNGKIYVYNNFKEGSINRNEVNKSLPFKSVTTIFFNQHMDLKLMFTTDSESLCYSIPVPTLKTLWLKPSWKGPSWFAKIDQDKRIFLYQGNVDKDSFYNLQPPKQPKGFPLNPVNCN